MIRKALPQFTLLIALFALPGISQAQARHKVTVEASVPFEFVVGNRAFPSGTYVFEMATGAPRSTDQAAVLVVRDHNRTLYAAVATDIATDSAAHATPKLVFKRNGDRVYLSKVWRQGNKAGLSVHLAAASIEVEDWQESEVLTLDAIPANEAI